MYKNDPDFDFDTRYVEEIEIDEGKSKRLSTKLQGMYWNMNTVQGKESKVDPS